MGRRRITDMQSHKFSVDISGKNKNAMDEYTYQYDMKYGPFLNFLIRKILRMQKPMSEYLRDCCLKKCDEINDAIITTEDEFTRQKLEQEKQEYLEMARLYAGGKEIDYDQKEDPTMTKYRVKDGYLIVPKDWIVLNPEFEGQCRYAGVVECRNSAKYGIPHFVFFTDIQYARDYDSDLEENVRDWCVEKWPDFTKVIQQEVKLIPDPENRGKYLNAEEHLASPVIGLFQILRNDDEHFKNDPPYGAMIVSAGTGKEEEKE